MKWFAVILAVVAFSGCHGHMPPQDNPWTDLETAVERFREYFSDLNAKANLLVEDLQKSQVVRELDTLTQDTIAELVELNKNLGPYTQERAQELAKDLEALSYRFKNNLVEAGSRATEYSQELQTLLDQSLSTFNAYARKMQKRVIKDKDTFDKSVTAYVEDVHYRSSTSVKDIQDKVEPLLAEVRESAEKKISTINRLLVTQVEKLSEWFSDMWKMRSTLSVY
ncbi:hypothetical protein NHX12_024216 [Muraenolepis orangiensis]|uniref:Apolipoprotein E n=1 Tax=Muraenolepis orangiensis TaxID=630683 RepID=A0A9Q0EM16_9TELE|nr:hypothetical protein NHX12_024216 [Muraenolepis orangiensis]